VTKCPHRHVARDAKSQPPDAALVVFTRDLVGSRGLRRTCYALGIPSTAVGTIIAELATPLDYLEIATCNMQLMVQR
jgi:hypothetical protein